MAATMSWAAQRSLHVTVAESVLSPRLDVAGQFARCPRGPARWRGHEGLQGPGVPFCDPPIGPLPACRQLWAPRSGLPAPAHCDPASSVSPNWFSFPLLLLGAPELSITSLSFAKLARAGETGGLELCIPPVCSGLQKTPSVRWGTRPAGTQDRPRRWGGHTVGTRGTEGQAPAPPVCLWAPTELAARVVTSTPDAGQFQMRSSRPWWRVFWLGTFLAP